jgi:hypothetical protein
LAQGSLADALQAVDSLDEVVRQAESLEERCNDLSETCRQIWRTALRDGGVSAMAEQVAHLDAFLQYAAVVEQECVAMDWRCNAGWRAAFRTQGSAAAERLLNEQRAALPSFGELQAPSDETPVKRIIRIVPGQAQASNEALRQAREAFNVGDIAGARQILTTASDQQQINGSTLIWSMTLIALTLTLLLSISVFWVRRSQRPRTTVAQSPRPTDADVLANLLRMPPDQGR